MSQKKYLIGDGVYKKSEIEADLIRKGDAFHSPYITSLDAIPMTQPYLRSWKKGKEKSIQKLLSSKSACFKVMISSNHPNALNSDKWEAELIHNGVKNKGFLKVLSGNSMQEFSQRGMSKEYYNSRARYRGEAITCYPGIFGFSESFSAVFKPSFAFKNTAIELKWIINNNKKD